MTATVSDDTQDRHDLHALEIGVVPKKPNDYHYVTTDTRHNPI